MSESALYAVSVYNIYTPCYNEFIKRALLRKGKDYESK